MSDASLSPLQRAALVIRRQRARLDALEDRQHGPVAVVGIGCRFPGGADSPEAFWDLLRRGGCPVREIPADRFGIDDWFDPAGRAPSSITARSGAFLDDVGRFDAGFFGISPREAAS